MSLRQLVMDVLIRLEIFGRCATIWRLKRAV